VLHCALECAPFVTVGGVADVVSGLSAAQAARGHRVTVVLPGVVAPPDGLPEGLEVLGLGLPGFDEAPYGHEVDRTGAATRRLGTLAAALTGLCDARAAAGRPPQVVHAHDWPVAMVPYLLRCLRDAGGPAPPPRTVLTVHDARLLGLLPEPALEHFGLGPEHAEELRFGAGLVSALLAGAMAADVVTTVSPRYAAEIVDPARELAIGPVLLARAEPLRGILNGIDTARWNPATDPALPARFDAGDPSGRAACKHVVQADLGLETRAATPLLVSVGRQWPEKGADLLAAAVPALVGLGAQLVVAGAGDPDLERALAAAAEGFPGKAVCLGHLPEPGVRRLLAAADLALIPSRSESCGIVQMQAQRYGAVPVAHATGGIVDTVVDAVDDPERATGFLFAPPTVEALVAAVWRALRMQRGDDWAPLVRRAMELDRSWDGAAALYEEVYRPAA